MRSFMIAIVPMVLAMALCGCATVAPRTALSVTPDVGDKVWAVEHVQQVRTEGASEIWLVLIRNKLPETAAVKVEVRAYTSEGGLAGWGVRCPELAQGQHAVEVPVNIPESMREKRKLGVTTVSVNGVWLGEFGAGIQTCRLWED